MKLLGIRRGAVTLEDVVDHIADGECIRQVNHRNVDLQFFENLSFELRKSDGIGSTRGQRFRSI